MSLHSAPAAGSGELLAPCPNSPNCVSSLAKDEEHRIEPFPLKGSGPESIARLRAALLDLPRTVLTLDTPTQLKAESTSLIFRFVDDIDFAFDDAANVIQARSASRVGYGDLGVNRKRMESLRAAYLK